MRQEINITVDATEPRDALLITTAIAALFQKAGRTVSVETPSVSDFNLVGGNEDTLNANFVRLAQDLHLNITVKNISV